MLIKAWVVEQLEKGLSSELQQTPVMSLANVPELARRFAHARAGQSVNIFSFEPRLLFEIEEVKP